MTRMRRDARGRFVGKAHHHHKKHHRHHRNPAMLAPAAAKVGMALGKKGALARAARVLIIR